MPNLLSYESKKRVTRFEAITSAVVSLTGINRVVRSTVTDANASHRWRIFAYFAQVSIGAVRPLCAAIQSGLDLDQSLYALESTTNDLCSPRFRGPSFASTGSWADRSAVLQLRMSWFSVRKSGRSGPSQAARIETGTQDGIKTSKRSKRRSALSKCAIRKPRWMGKESGRFLGEAGKNIGIFRDLRTARPTAK